MCLDLNELNVQDTFGKQRQNRESRYHNQR